MSGWVVDLRSARKVFLSRRGHEPVVAVDGLTLGIPRGEILGLLGPNGAGKSTAVRMIAGLVRPTDGRILVEGYDVVRQRAQALRYVGVVLDRGRNLYPRLTPWENIQYFGVMRGLSDISGLRARAGEWLEFFSIGDVAHKPINDLSMGTRQRVALAAALSAKPHIVLLDEPTLGLDVQSSMELRKAIRRMAHEEGCTVIITTHQMDVAQDICDRVCILSKGRVLALDTVKHLLNIFDSRAYTLTLAGILGDEARMELACLGKMQVLEESVDGEDVGSSGYMVVDIDVPDERGLFKAMEVLRLAGVGIESITRREPCLETVFLRLTREEGERWNAPPSGMD